MASEHASRQDQDRAASPGFTASGHPRMSVADRAKIFIPFSPLKGFEEALRQKEAEADAREQSERVGLEELR